MPILTPRFYFITQRSIYPLDVGSFLAQTRDQWIDTTWRGKANSFRFPSGKNHGEGWFLLARSDYLELADENQVTLGIKEDGAQGTKLTFNKLYITSGIALDGSPGNKSGNAAILIHVVDVRYLGLMTAVSKRYNVRTPGVTSSYDPTSTENGSSPWTWNGILEDIWTYHLPADFGEYPGLSDAPMTTPEGYTFNQVNAWESFNYVLDDAGYVVQLSPDGTFSFLKKDSDQQEPNVSQYKDRIIQSRDDYAFPNQIKKIQLPEIVRVTFISEVHDYQNTLSNAPPTAQDRWLANATYHKNIYTADIIETSGPTGTVKLINSDMRARYDDTGEITNQSELDAEAQEHAERYLQEVTPDRNVDCYTGLVEILPYPTSTDVNEVTWEDVGQGYVTKVLYDSRIVSVLKLPTTNADTLVPSEEDRNIGQESVSPILDKATMPIHRFLIGTLTENLEAFGVATVSARYGTFSLGTGKISWTVDSSHQVEVHETQGLTFKSGDVVVATTWFQVGKWVMVSGVGNPSELVRFRLSSNKPYDDNALGHVLLWNESTSQYEITGDLVALVDSMGKWGPTENVNAEGWATVKSDRTTVTIGPTEYTAYEIVWMEGMARFGDATLDEDMGKTTPGQAQATVSGGDLHWGAAPNHHQTLLTTIQVYDRYGAVPKAKAGSKVFWILDEVRDQKVVFAPQDSYKVMVNADDTPDYLKDQFIDLVYPIDYSPSQHSVVKVGVDNLSPPDGTPPALRLYFDTPSGGGINTDETVKVSSIDTAEYLDTQFWPIESFSPGEHIEVYWSTVGDQGLQMHGHIRTPLDQYVKVDGNDDPGYLSEQIVPLGGGPSAEDLIVQWVVLGAGGNSTMQGYIEKAYVKDELVATSSGDTPAYLSEQLKPGGTQSGNDPTVYWRVASDLSDTWMVGFIKESELPSSVDEKVAILSGNTPDYLFPLMANHDTYVGATDVMCATNAISGEVQIFAQMDLVPGWSLSGDQVLKNVSGSITWGDPAAVADDKLVAVSSGDTPAYLEEQFIDVSTTPMASDEQPVRFYSDGAIMKGITDKYPEGTDIFVSVSASDTGGYLFPKFADQGTFTGLDVPILFEEVSGGTQVRGFLPHSFLPTDFDENVKASSGDPTPDYLITKLNPGGDLNAPMQVSFYLIANDLIGGSIPSDSLPGIDIEVLTDWEVQGSQIMGLFRPVRVLSAGTAVWRELDVVETCPQEAVGLIGFVVDKVMKLMGR